MARVSAAKLADDLGKLRAKMFPLLVQEVEIKKHLIALSNGVNKGYDGAKYRATVSHYEQKNLIAAKVKKLLTKRQITSCTKVSDCAVVKVVALNRKAKK